MADPNFIMLGDMVNEARSSLDRILDRIRSELSLGEHDIDVIRRVNLSLSEPTPSVQLAIQNRVSSLDSMRVELLDLIFNVSVHASDMEYKYKSAYDREFARPVKADRPSQQAIDSEIHANSQSLQDMRTTLGNYDALKGLLFGYLKSLDKSRETCMKLWGTY